MLNVAGYLAGGGGSEGKYVYEVLPSEDSVYEIKESNCYGGTSSYMCAIPQYRYQDVDVYFAENYTFDENTGIFTLDPASLYIINLPNTDRKEINPTTTSGYVYVIFGSSSGREMFKCSSNSSYKPRIARYGTYGYPMIYDGNNYVFRYISVKKIPDGRGNFITESEKEHDAWTESDGNYYALPYAKRTEFTSPKYNSSIGTFAGARETDFFLENPNKILYMYKNSYYWYGYEATTEDNWKSMTRTLTLTSPFITKVLDGCLFVVNNVVYHLNFDGILRRAWRGAWEELGSIPSNTAYHVCAVYNGVAHFLSRDSGTAYYYTFDGSSWTLIRTYENLWSVNHGDCTFSNCYVYDGKIYFGQRTEWALFELDLETAEIRRYETPFEIGYYPIMVKDRIAFVISMSSNSNYIPNYKSVLCIDLNDGTYYWLENAITDASGFYKVPFVTINDGGALFNGYVNSSGTYGTSMYQINMLREERK